LNGAKVGETRHLDQRNPVGATADINGWLLDIAMETGKNKRGVVR
jgi:hypothetical protein